jgi:tetratricopeptide (TPR) repeat protein
MDPIEEAAHDLDEAREAAVPMRVRRAATVVISVAALLAAGAGYLAARANWEVSVEERTRSLATAEAQRALHHLSLEAAELTEANTLSTEALVRVGAAGDRLAVAGAAERPGLRRSIARWQAVAGRTSPGTLSPESLARGYGPVVAAQQRAGAHAELAEEWTAHESANLGIAGLAAVAGLLVGTALSMPATRRPQRFLAIAGLVVAFGAARLAYVNAEDPHGLPDAALAAYVEGTVAQQLHDPASAVQSFVKAVEVEPEYAAAWQALGDSYLADVDARTAGWATEAYERVLELEHPTGTVLNNLAYAGLLAGHTDAAAVHAAAAQELLPDDPRVAATVAEVLVARGERRAALTAADRLIARVAEESESLREELFSALRRDELDLTAAGVSPALRDEFFARFRRAAATLEAYRSPSPHPAGDGSVAIGTAWDRSSLLMTYTLTCRGVRPEDRVGVRVYRGTQLVASAAHRVARTPCPIRAALPVNEGTYTVEVYLNGNPAGSEQVAFR